LRIEKCLHCLKGPQAAMIHDFTQLPGNAEFFGNQRPKMPDLGAVGMGRKDVGKRLHGRKQGKGTV